MSSAQLKTRSWSLRGRLIWLFAGGGFAAWVFSGAMVVALVERDDRGNWDIALERSAMVILRLAQDEYRESGKLDGLRGEVPLQFSGQMIQIRDAAGRLLLRTDDAPIAALANPDRRFSDIQLPGDEWRVGTFVDRNSGLSIQIADSQSRRKHEFLQLGLALLVPLIVGLPIVMIGAWLLAARALQPLRHAAHLLGARERSDLSPIGVGELPQEAVPLVDSFNHVLRQLAESWEDERRFAASVAHELRTPLAGIRLNLQRLQNYAASQDVRARLAVLVGAVDRATRVIEQLMTLARLERNLSRELGHETVDLQRTIHETLSEFSARTGERDIRFEVLADKSPARIPLQAFYLVLRNFVENAVRHSPRGGVIRISADHSAEFWRVQVEDAGPGLLPLAAPISKTEERSLSTENLQIGLSLVRKIAELFGGRIESGRSERLGGASFRFSAPVRREADVEDGGAVSGAPQS